MIDYEKLKIAHELAEKYTQQTGVSVVITLNMCFGGAVDCGHEIYFGIEKPNENDEGISLDGIIEKLTELTKPRSKYERRQYVCVLDEANKPTHKRILNVRFDEYSHGYVCEITDSLGEPYWITENSLYASKQELIQSQITYWQSLLKSEEIYIPEEVQNNTVEYKIDYTHSDTPRSSCCSVHAGTQEECKEECQHESDGNLYHQNGVYVIAIDEVRTPFTPSEKMKCKKCGEFYR